MTRRTMALTALSLALLLAACAGGATDAPTPAIESAAPTPPPQTAVVSPAPSATPAPAPTATLPAPPPARATREGADYVLRLPRDDVVPAAWAMGT